MEPRARHTAAKGEGRQGYWRQIVVQILLPVLVVASLLVIRPDHTFAINTTGPPTPGGPGSPGSGTLVPGAGTVCWSADGGPDGGASVCFGCPCAPCVQTPTQVPLDNITKLDVAQEGLMAPSGPSGGWTCGIPGPSAPPAFAWPAFKVSAVNTVANGKVKPGDTGPAMLVWVKETASLLPANCPLTNALVGSESSPYAPNTPPPPVGSTPEYDVSYLNPPAGCPNALTINGQDANYVYRFHEINAIVPASGCTAAKPYKWDWSVGVNPAISGAQFCDGKTSSYTYEHVVNPPGVATSAQVRWQPYCGGWVFSNATGTTSTFPLSPGTQTVNGITLKCDPGVTQTFNADPQRPVDQIESIAKG